jgi:hypothetical protein
MEGKLFPCQDENVPAKAGKRNDQIMPPFRKETSRGVEFAPVFPDGRQPVHNASRIRSYLNGVNNGLT